MSWGIDLIEPVRKHRNSGAAFHPKGSAMGCRIDTNGQATDNDQARPCGLCGKPGRIPHPLRTCLPATHNR
jgi:hypothetical protein